MMNFLTKTLQVKIQVSRASPNRDNLGFEKLSGAVYDGTRMNTIWEFRQAYVHLNGVTSYLPVFDSRL